MDMLVKKTLFLVVAAIAGWVLAGGSLVARADVLNDESATVERTDSVWTFKRAVEVTSGQLNDYEGKIKCTVDVVAASKVFVQRHNVVRDFSLVDFEDTSHAAAHIFNCYVNDTGVNYDFSGNKVSIDIDEVDDGNGGAKGVKIKIEDAAGASATFRGAETTFHSVE